MKMNKWEQLDNAISVATCAHFSQFDKGGKPYILHPLHLMNQLMFDPELATIAVLHDVIEDSNFTIDYFIAWEYSQRVIDALILLTHNPKDSYQEYIEKIATNYDAIRVKRKDLEHNLDVTRLKVKESLGYDLDLTQLKASAEKQILRTMKYHEAFIFLGKAKASFK